MNIAIIGIGHVGSSTAYSLMSNHLVSELTLIDVKKERLNAEYLDLRDAKQIINPDVIINVNDYQKLDDADVLIISVGPIDIIKVEDRLEELPITKKIIDEISVKILETKFNGLIISITNPCDVIATYLQYKLDYPHHKLIGSGTILDSSRLVNITNNQDDFVIGEHGESQVGLYNISDNDLEKARSIGWHIFKEKQYTNFGIAASITNIVNNISNNTNSFLNFSNYDYDKKVYYGYPAQIDLSGVTKRGSLSLSLNEQQSLDKSIEVIKECFDKIK